MDIFELVKNDKFFNPFSSKNRKIYFDCILLLIEKSKEIPVLYDSDARNCITIYLKNSEYIFQDEQDASEPITEIPERNASDIMTYLRECGWIAQKEIGRNGENVTNVASHCRRIIEFFMKMSEKSSEGAISNHIFSMYEILKTSFQENSARAERPYSNILKPLLHNVLELKDEMLDLRDNISNIMRLVMELQDANSVGKFLMKDELLERFFNDYFFIKNNGLIPSQIAYIKDKLRIIAQGELLEKMASECALQLQIKEQSAMERVEAHILELQYFLTVEYEENIELIDARINTYYNLANTRIMLVMSNGINMEAVLDSFLTAQKAMSDEEKNNALEKVSKCLMINSQKYISRKSYEKRIRKERDDSKIGLELCEISEDEKSRRTKELIGNAKNRFSIDGVNQFLENRMHKNNQAELEARSITSREDAIMFVTSMMYSGIDEFAYEVELKDGYIETDIAKISDMKIRKK